jgi:hypothetical protein
VVHQFQGRNASRTGAESMGKYSDGPPEGVALPRPENVGTRSPVPRSHLGLIYPTSAVSIFDQALSRPGDPGSIDEPRVRGLPVAPKARRKEARASLGCKRGQLAEAYKRRPENTGQGLPKDAKGLGG